MRIAVLMGALSLSFRKSLDLSTCRQDPMGMSGTDYCVLRVAECLRDLGHSVVLRCVSAEAGTTWNGIEVIGPPDKIPPCDACIAVNEPDELRDAPAGAFRVAYMLLNDISFGRCGVSDHVDLFVSPSNPHLEQFRTNPAWHRVQVSPTHPDGAETFRFDESKWTVVPLGCDPDRLVSDLYCHEEDSVDGDLVAYEEPRREKVPGKVVYCSSPDRGLHWLLQEWPRIKAAVSHATLHIYYRLAPWLRGFDATPHYPPIEPLRYRANYIEECLRRYAAKGGMGITVHDSVSRDVIEREMASAEVLAYPCATTTWSEGFSCTILECCAARACPVITDCDALGEVYADIDPVPMQGDWVREWGDRVIRALTDAEWREAQNEKGLALAEKLTWKRTAEKLLEEITCRKPAA